MGTVTQLGRRSRSRILGQMAVPEHRVGAAIRHVLETPYDLAVGAPVTCPRRSDECFEVVHIQSDRDLHIRCRPTAQRISEFGRFLKEVPAGYRRAGSGRSAQGRAILTVSVEVAVKPLSGQKLNVSPSASVTLSTSARSHRRRP